MKRNLLIYSLLVLLFTACGNDDPAEPVLTPAIATLVAPANNAACEQGADATDTQVNLNLVWQAAENADKYTVNLTNLTTNKVKTLTTTAVSVNLKVDKGVAYSWNIVSTSDEVTETATSEVWKFYVAGDGISNYAPFPAEVIAPVSGSDIATDKVVLEWRGEDMDDTEITYELFFGEVSPPTTSLGTTTNSSWDEITVADTKQYFWKVVSTDPKGNASTSPVFSFNVGQITASFTASATTAETGQAIDFTNTSIGSGDEYAWVVTMGDETVFTSALANPSFTFTKVGTYSVNLKVGKAGVAFKSEVNKPDFITITETTAVPTLTNLFPSGTFEGRTVPVDWNALTWELKGDATLAIDPTGGIDGSAAFKGSYTADAASALKSFSDGDKSKTDQLFHFVEGKTYKVKASFKYTGGEPTNAILNFVAYAPYKDASTYRLTVPGSELVANEWKEFETTFVATGVLMSGDSQEMSINVKGAGVAGAVYVDNLEVYQID